MPEATPVEFFVKYLLLPALTLIVATALISINQKKGLLSGRQVLVLLLTFILPMTLAGLFGFIGLWFMPWYYVLVQVCFLIVGIFYLYQLDQVLGQDRHDQALFVHLLTGLILLLGLYFFSLIFNTFSSLPYGLWAASCLLPFYIPLLFSQTYTALLAIPNEIHKVWYYPRQASEIVLDGVDYYRLMILEIELRKSPGAMEAPIKVKARTTQDLPFGLWFQKFIDDYNYKFPNDPIHTANANEVEYGWLFYYIRPSLFRLRRYVDFDLSIAHNHLNERCTIVAKRVEET